MTYADDFVLLNFEHGVVFQLCLALGLEWPPPERIEAFGMPMTRKRFSQITDDQRGEMTHVCRGAEYFTAEAAPMKPDISTPSSSASGDVAQSAGLTKRDGIAKVHAAIKRVRDYAGMSGNDSWCKTLRLVCDEAERALGWQKVAEANRVAYEVAESLRDAASSSGSRTPTPPEAAGSDEPRHLTRDEQQMLGRALRRSAKVIDNPATDLAPGLNDTNDLVRQIRAFLADAPKGKPHEGYRYGELLSQAADRIEQLQRERDEALDRAHAAHKELCAVRLDIAEATGHIIVQPVEPGTDLARVLAANAQFHATIERQRRVLVLADVLADVLQSKIHGNGQWPGGEDGKALKTYRDARRQLQEGA